MGFLQEKTMFTWLKSKF